VAEIELLGGAPSGELPSCTDGRQPTIPVTAQPKHVSSTMTARCVNRSLQPAAL
jgi:hypothetical protein